MTDPPPGAGEPARIALIGFMASGKTTVGAVLARRLGWEFIDLDSVIERRAGCAIAEIFAVHGEPWFRQLESASLREAAARDRAVIATGGGVPVREANEWFFRDPGTLVFHLHVSLEGALERTRGDASRPLLARTPAEVEQLYATRLPRYEELGARIATDGKAPEDVAEEIVSRWSGRGSAARGSR